MLLWLFIYKIINCRAFSLLAILKSLLSQLNFIIIGKIYSGKGGVDKNGIYVLSIFAVINH